jgi:3-methyladenine DNA glycosylase AlkC
MAKKFKDYYDKDCAELLAGKIKAVWEDFDSGGFVRFVEEGLEGKEFGERQDLFAEGFEKFMKEDFVQNLEIFEKILGEELQESKGMFTEGWWLWPVGRYVERNGLKDFEASVEFIYELTKRFTGEFAIRPLLMEFPEKTLEVLLEWSKDENVHVRRLASEGMRIKLPWASKQEVVLENENFSMFVEVLTNLKDDQDKFVMKSVGNNLNDLYKVDRKKAEEILRDWEAGEVSKSCEWVMKHGRRSLKKKS